LKEWLKAQALRSHGLLNSEIVTLWEQVRASVEAVANNSTMYVLCLVFIYDLAILLRPLLHKI